MSGAAAGLAFAVGMGGRRLLATAPAGGFAGAVLGAVAFDLIGAGLFPMADTGDPVSLTWASRLTARLLVALATAAGVILVLPTYRDALFGPLRREGCPRFAGALSLVYLMMVE